MLLNNKYYQDIWFKYKEIKTLPLPSSNNILLLTQKIILSQIQQNRSIHFNFHNKREMLYDIGFALFIELANKIFCNTVDYPNYKINDLVRSKGKISKKNLLFKIEKIETEHYTLKGVSRNHEEMRLPSRTYEKLIEEFTPVTQNVRDKTLKRFYEYFKILNNGNIHDFDPTDFTQKCVFIAPKKFWDELKEIKTKIPCVYLSNHRDENNEDEIKSIRALSDCIMYVTPKYETCYQNIIMTGKIIHTIVVLDCEEDKVEQIISDKNRFNFNIVLLTNSLEQKKYTQIPMWNWFNEEIEIVNTI